MLTAAACLIAYLVGSIPFGLLIARMHGIDIRAAGSGNIGATNVVRQLGRRVGALVFLLDFAKGAIPVLLGPRIDGPDWLPVAVGVCALLGHMFPVWLRFRGGKGVATGTGIVAVLLPIPAAIALLVWLAVVSSTRYVSLASIAAAGAVAGSRLLLTAEPWHADQRILTAFALVAFVLVVARHADNIARLIRGRELPVSESRLMRGIAKVIHVLAVGLWFGSNVFFTFVAAVVIFKTWETYGETSFGERPVWLPFGAGFNKEAGTRVAGATVAPIFPFFFLIQGVCAFLTLITALGFSRLEPGRRVHRVRFWMLLLAALTVIAGWPLAQRVGSLRAERYHSDENISRPAKEQFGRLYAASLFLNFGTIGLVGAATALAAFLPSSTLSRERSVAT